MNEREPDLHAWASSGVRGPKPKHSFLNHKSRLTWKYFLSLLEKPVSSKAIKNVNSMTEYKFMTYVHPPLLLVLFSKRSRFIEGILCLHRVQATRGKVSRSILDFKASMAWNFYEYHGRGRRRLGMRNAAVSHTPEKAIFIETIYKPLRKRELSHKSHRRWAG